MAYTVIEFQSDIIVYSLVEGNQLYDEISGEQIVPFYLQFELNF